MNALSRMWLNSRFPSEPIVIKDAIIPVYLEVAVLRSFRLYKITFSGKHVQGAVDIVLPIGEPFKIVRCRPVGGAKQECQDNTDRIAVERVFSLSKRCYGMGLIMTKLEETQLTTIALSVFVTNLFKVQRRILYALLRICQFLTQNMLY